MNMEKENSYSKSSIGRSQWVNNQSNSGMSANQRSVSSSILPPLKETNKFSSWADKSIFD